MPVFTRTQLEAQENKGDLKEAEALVLSLDLTGTRAAGREGGPKKTKTTGKEGLVTAEKANKRKKGQVGIARNGAIPNKPKLQTGKNPQGKKEPCKGVPQPAPQSIIMEDEEEKDNDENDTQGSEPEEREEENKTPNDLSKGTILQRVGVNEQDQAQIMSEFLKGKEVKGPEPIDWDQTSTPPLDEAYLGGRTRVTQPFEQLILWSTLRQASGTHRRDQLPDDQENWCHATVLNHGQENKITNLNHPNLGEARTCQKL